jgi:hypothetical protein
MDAHSHDDADVRAEHTTHLISHLEGVLDASMLQAMSGVWSTLEHAAADGPAHARAVRSRLFWESLSPGGAAAAPMASVYDLVPAWNEDEDSAEALDADAA